MEYLTGGRENQIGRSGKLLYRPAGFWSPSVHLLLKHVRLNGFDRAPEPMGFAENGHEILTFIEGEVSNYPLSTAAASQEALVSAARLLRAYHDASASFLSSAARNLQWMLPPQFPAEVVCHGDFAPYNVVLNGCTAVAIIDFDTAHPGPRIWDIAYGLYRWVPLKDPSDPASLGDLDAQIQRAKQFCDAYGLPSHDRQTIVDAAVSRLQALIDFIHTKAAKGNETFQAHLADGHHWVYRDDIAYLRQNRELIIQGIQ